jgi:hypothetical protein
MAEPSEAPTLAFKESPEIRQTPIGLRGPATRYVKPIDPGNDYEDAETLMGQMEVDARSPGRRPPAMRSMTAPAMKPDSSGPANARAGAYGIALAGQAIGRNMRWTDGTGRPKCPALAAVKMSHRSALP